MKRDLEPGGPENTEEANIAEKIVHVGNGVVSSEGGQIGYEEQIKEQLQTVCFMALGEDEIVWISSSKRRFN